MDNSQEDQEEVDFSGILNKVKNYLTQEYTPVYNPVDCAIHYTTQEIYERLQQVFPSDIFNGEMVALWLHQAGFTFYDYGLMKLEWMLNKA